ncbi:hypothetical protein ACO0SA_002854 [Hanseniaspora valbyensis]
MIGLGRSVSASSNTISDTTIYTNNISPTFYTVLYYLKVVLYHIPLAIFGFVFNCCKFSITGLYLTSKFILLNIPLGFISFIKLYVEHMIYVIIDSFFWPIDIVLGLKPIYQDDNMVNQCLHGKCKFPFSLYGNVLINDIIFPIFLNGLILIGICFFVATTLVLFHKLVMMLYTDKLVFNVTPFKTIQGMYNSLFDDLLWILSLVEDTLKTITDLISPLTYIRQSTSKQDPENKGKKFKIQKELNDYKDNALKEMPGMASNVRNKVFNAIRNKVESSLSASSSSSSSSVNKNSKTNLHKEQVTPDINIEKSKPSTQGSCNSSMSKEDIDDSQMIHNSHKLRRLSSIELASALPKDYFQIKNKNTDETTFIDEDNIDIKIQANITDISSNATAVKQKDLDDKDSVGLSKRKLKNKSINKEDEN